MPNIPITPLAVTKRYIVGANTQLFSASPVVDSWTVNGGATRTPTVNSTSTTVTFPNKTQTITVTAVDGADSGTASLFTYGTWPVPPHVEYEAPLDNKTLASYAEDDSAVFRRKGGLKFRWNLNFNNIPATDWILIRDFFNFHQKDIPFYFEDLELKENIASVETPILRLVTADSGLKIGIAGPDRYNLSIAFKEV